MENKSELLIRLLKEGKINSDELLVLAMNNEPSQVEYIPYVPAPIEPYFPAFPWDTTPLNPWFVPPFTYTTC
jgi:hypothetical protein